jgi:hypothetical protein
MRESAVFVGSLAYYNVYYDDAFRMGRSEEQDSTKRDTRASASKPQLGCSLIPITFY